MFTKVAIDDGVPPAFLAWVRVVLGGIVLLALAWSAGGVARSLALAGGLRGDRDRDPVALIAAG